MEELLLSIQNAVAERLPKDMEDLANILRYLGGDVFETHHEYIGVNFDGQSFMLDWEAWFSDEIPTGLTLEYIDDDIEGIDQFL